MVTSWCLYFMKAQNRLRMSERSSDVDPDPVGSAFIWVPGSGPGSRIKLRKKQEFN